MFQVPFKLATTCNEMFEVIARFAEIGGYSEVTRTFSVVVASE